MKKKLFTFLEVAFASLALCSASAFGQVPQLVNYQGRVAVGSVNFDGSGLFKFAFVDTSGTTAYWTNDDTHLDGTEPDTAVTIPVVKGLYSVLLGDATLPNMQVVPATVFTHSEVYLRVWFNDGQHGFQLLTPDQRIAAVGYAMMAGTAQSVADGAITSEKIAPGAVGSVQLATAGVQSSNIATGAVDNSKLATPSITFTAGAGLNGGGTVTLGGNVSLSNGGVTSIQGNGGITVSGTTGSITLGSNATETNTPGAIVLRGSNGDFSAGSITATEFLGNGDGLTGIAGTLPWQVVNGVNQLAVANTGYLATDSGLVTIMLPAVANAGDIVRVSGVGAGGWSINPNAGQSIIGFAPGFGPAGSMGASGAVQCTGTNIWQPIKESQLADGAIRTANIAAGAVGSSQLAPNLSLSGTISAANFTGNGQGLTGLSASSLTTGTLSDGLLSTNVAKLNAASNIFTGTFRTSGTFDASNASIVGFDKVSLSGSNLWTGLQTFSNLTVSGSTPYTVFQDTTISGSVGVSTDGNDPMHDFMLMGINMKPVPNGFAIMGPTESAWGLVLERDYFNGETVQHEAYFSDGGSARPFTVGYSQRSNADVESIVGGTVTISNAEQNDFLIPGLRFRFTALTDNINVSSGTFYAVKSVINSTQFTFMDRWGGPAIDASATSGTMTRGGWGSAGFNVPTVISSDNYDSQDTPSGTALQVVNLKSDHDAVVRLDNDAGSRVDLDFDQKWRLGTDLDGTQTDNFYLMNFATQDAPLQVDSSSRVAVGYKHSEDGYSLHNNTGTLDVNGVIVATGTSLPEVVENGLIVVSGTAYLGSSGSWRALNFSP